MQLHKKNELVLDDVHTATKVVVAACEANFAPCAVSAKIQIQRNKYKYPHAVARNSLSMQLHKAKTVLRQ